MVMFTLRLLLTLFVTSAYSKRIGRRTTTVVNSNSNNNNIEGLADLRKEYSSIGLDETTISPNPFELFKDWFENAQESGIPEPNAFCLSTCHENKPSARVVLLKHFDDRGFVFYTNYNSRKSNELISNPNAALTFLWVELERSVRIEGVAEKVSSDESDEYFNSRPRGSRVGAWTSNQSESIGSRQELEEQETNIKKKFEGSEVIERPDHWGGYRIRPTRIEFWKGRESRLHDRIVYTSSDDDGGGSGNAWDIERLQP